MTAGEKDPEDVKQEKLPLPEQESSKLISHQEAAGALMKAEQEASTGRLTGPLILSVVACAIGSSWQFGYNIGVVNPPEEVIKHWISNTSGRYNVLEGNVTKNPLGKTEVDDLWGWIVAVFAIGGMLGGLVCGMVADKFGRKGGMLLNNVFAFAAAALMGFAKTSGLWELLLIGRLVVGFNSGINCGLASLYLTEIAPDNLRGALGTVHQLAITIAIFVSMILGLEFVFGNESYWAILFGFLAVPSVVQLCLLPFCPESPKHLLIVMRQRENAERALIKLRKTEDVKTELDAIQVEADRAKTTPKATFGDMFKYPLRWPLFVACMMMLAQQLTGINAAMFYSTKIFREGAKLGDNAVYASIAMAFLNVVMTIVATGVVEKAGRKVLLLTGLSGMCVSSVLLVVMLVLVQSGHSWAGYLGIVFVLTFVCSFAIGPGPIPWFFVSELFLQGARGNANAIAGVVNWSATFLVGKIFPFMHTGMGPYSFLVFTFFAVVFIIFTWKWVPETKGRSVDEIVEEFQKR